MVWPRSAEGVVLEEPELDRVALLACPLESYGVVVDRLDFLPLGADRNTAVYHVAAQGPMSLFLKLRRGPLAPMALALPKFLAEQGLSQVIAPLATRSSELSASLPPFTLSLFPFIGGEDAYRVPLSDRQWRVLGNALHSLHAVRLAPKLAQAIPAETFSSEWRDLVGGFLGRPAAAESADPVTIELASFLKTRRREILDLVGRAEQLARSLRSASLEFVVCHSDIHAGNLLIAASGDLYLVDWDAPTLAPKERDLMSVGAGLCGAGHTPEEEEMLFYQGYGRTRVDPAALAYFRYERIVQDIAVFCDQIFFRPGSREDREQALRYLKSNFEPNKTIDLARRADSSRP
jgi:spectinomycin phosphotransferase